MERAGNLINNFDRNMGKLFTIRAAWTDIAGEVLAAHSEPVRLSSTALLVICDSPVWVQQISVLNDKVCAQIKKVSGIRVKTLEGRFGVLPGRKNTSKPRQPAHKPEIDPSVLSGIEDPEMRALVENLLAIQDEDPHA